MLDFLKFSKSDYGCIPHILHVPPERAFFRDVRRGNKGCYVVSEGGCPAWHRMQGGLLLTEIRELLDPPCDLSSESTQGKARTIKTIYLARNHSTSHFRDCSKPSEPSISEKRCWSLNIAASHWVFLCVCLCLSMCISLCLCLSLLSHLSCLPSPIFILPSLPSLHCLSAHLN